MALQPCEIPLKYLLFQKKITKQNPISEMQTNFNFGFIACSFIKVLITRQIETFYIRLQAEASGWNFDLVETGAQPGFC